MQCNAVQYCNAGQCNMMSYVICCYPMRSDVIGCNSDHVQDDMSVTDVIQCDAM